MHEVQPGNIDGEGDDRYRHADLKIVDETDLDSFAERLFDDNQVRERSEQGEIAGKVLALASARPVLMP